MNHVDYLAFRRMMIFLDEWGFYGMLAYSYFYLPLLITWAVGIYGGMTILVSYIYLQKLESAYGIYDTRCNRLFKNYHVVERKKDE